MQTVASDLSLFFRWSRSQLTGLIASYVDDTLAWSESSFSKLTEETRKIFEAKSHEYENMRFSGVYIDRSDNSFNIHRRGYIDCLKPIGRKLCTVTTEWYSIIMAHPQSS